MGLAGTVTLKRYPERGPYWYAVFRLRKPGDTGRGELRSLSTKETESRKAEPIAAFLFMKAMADYCGYSLVPKSPATPQIPGWPDPKAASLAPAGVTPTPKIVPLSSALDPEIQTIIDLFWPEAQHKDKLHDCYMAEATPGGTHPQIETARTYRRRLRQLCSILGITKHSELVAAYKGPLTATKLREKQRHAGVEDKKLVTDDNFVPLVRGAAGVYSAQALEYYESRGITIKTPFPSLPPLRPKFFAAPSDAFLDKLDLLAETEMRNHKDRHRDYKLYRVSKRLGGRTQELTHIRWEDVLKNGIWVGPRKTGKSRFVQLRDHGEPDELLDYLETFRGKPEDYIIPDEECPCAKKKDGEVKERLGRVASRLNEWLREKIAAEGHGNVVQCIHWLRKCVEDRIERTEGAVARARALGMDVVAAAKKDVGYQHAAARQGHAPNVAAQVYISPRTAAIPERKRSA